MPNDTRSSLSSASNMPNMQQTKKIEVNSLIIVKSKTLSLNELYVKTKPCSLIPEVSLVCVINCRSNALGRSARFHQAHPTYIVQHSSCVQKNGQSLQDEGGSEGFHRWWPFQSIWWCRPPFEVYASTSKSVPWRTSRTPMAAYHTAQHEQSQLLMGQVSWWSESVAHY